MRSAAVRCIGVFLSKVPFSSLEGHIFMILHTKEANLDQQFYSDSRLKLVTLAILRLSWEIGRDEQIGTFCLGTSYLMTITGLARAIVTDMFELPTATPRNCVGMSGERTEKSHRQHSERAISSSLDLLAATFLVLYPSKLRNKDSLLRNSFTKKSLLSEFIENVLTDGSGVVRVGSIMQEEIYKRATDRCLVSLNSDSNLSSIADSLLIVDDDKMNSPQSFSRSRQTPLSLAVPSSETIDSLHTTGETSMTVSMGSVHSTSSLIFSPTNSNSNTPLSPMSHNNNDGNESTDGVDSDMDRSKLSTLKRNKNRNVPRRQTYGGALGVEVARPTTPDFFVTTDRSASVREAAIGGSLSHGNSRSKAEFSKLLAQRATQSKVVGEANRIHCRAAVVRDKIFGTDEFSEVHVTPNHTSSFLRPNRPDVDALDEDDVVVSDADEFDEEIEMHIGFDVDSGDDASTVHEVNDNPDLLAFTGVSFMQGLGARTAEERTRSHKQPYSNHSSGRTERSKSVQCPQTPVAVAIYGADGQRTQELVVQCHTSERTSKRAVVGLGAPRGVRALGVSSSLPGHVSPSLSGDSLESSSTYGCPIVVRESRVADLPSLRFSTHNGRDRDRDRNDPTGNISNESVSMTGFSNTRKMRVMHSPRSTTSTVVSASASSSSSRCSSPKGSNKTAVTTNGSGGKVELKNRNRVRVTRDHDDDSQNQSHEQRHEQESKSGLKEYQLAGVSRQINQST